MSRWSLDIEEYDNLDNLITLEWLVDTFVGFEGRYGDCRLGWNMYVPVAEGSSLLLCTVGRFFCCLSYTIVRFGAQLTLWMLFTIVHVYFTW